MTVVVDTNCLLASIPPQSPWCWLYQAFEQERFTWAVSTEILLEYDEVIVRIYSKKTADLVLNLLLTAPNVLLLEPFYHWQVLSDPDDNKFFDVAVAANADCIVSNDKGFNLLVNLEFPKVKVYNLQEFKVFL